MEKVPHTFTTFLSASSFLKPRRITESAWLQHVPFAFWLMEQAKPKLFVELGVHTGMSYFAFCQSVKTNRLSTLCYAVDTWMGDEHAGIYSEDVWRDVQDYNRRECAAFSYLLRTTFNEALAYFDDKTIDLLHIDGCHTYEAVKADFEKWRPKMADNAIVVFHDTVVRERNFGVYKFWAELKQQYPSFEFIHNHGLGVMTLGHSPVSALQALFQLADENEINEVRLAYAGLGAGLAESYENIMLHNQLAHANTQYQTVQEQYAQLINAQESLQAAHQQLTQHHAATTAESEVLKKLLEQAENERAGLAATAAQSGQELNQLQTGLENAMAARIELEKETTVIKAAHAALQLEVAYLKQERETFTQLQADGSTAYAQLKEQYAQLKINLEELEAMHAATSIRYGQLQNEHEGLHTQHRKLRNEYDFAQQQLEQYIQQEAVLKNDLKQAEKTYLLLKTKHDDLKKLLQQANESADRAQNDCSRWKNNFESSNRELCAVKDELVRSKASLQQTIKEYEKEKQEVHGLLNEQTSRLSDLMSELSKEKLLSQTLQTNIQHQQEALQWYKRTYEDRKLLGIIKDRFFTK